MILWNHDADAPPIGTAEDFAVDESGQLTMTVVFASAEANPEAERVFRLVCEGVVKGVSVGFDWRGPAGTAQLVEVSFVPIPKDEDALASAPATRTDASACHCTRYQIRDASTGKLRDAVDCSCPGTYAMSDARSDRHEHKETRMTTARTDADDAKEIAVMNEARAKRDARLTEVGRVGAPSANLDAKGRGIKRALREKMPGETFAKGERRALRALVGDANIGAATPGFLARALAHVRATTTPTDAAEPLDVEAARAARDARAYAAGR